MRRAHCPRRWAAQVRWANSCKQWRVSAPAALQPMSCILSPSALTRRSRRCRRPTNDGPAAQSGRSPPQGEGDGRGARVMPVYTYTPLDDPAALPGTTQAYGINTSGQIVGSYSLGAHKDYGFLYSGGTYTTL